MRIFHSAYKHHVSRANILHAWHFAVGPVHIDDEREPPTYIFVGPGITGMVWYEIGVVMHPSHDQITVIHAMKARPKYLRKAGLQ
ncbi:hypothetical protein JS539_02320 [Bifidobacterium simiarum]|nr:hypothetical protein [Bifidobacterium simiarum]